MDKCLLKLCCVKPRIKASSSPALSFSRCPPYSISIVSTTASYEERISLRGSAARVAVQFQWTGVLVGRNVKEKQKKKIPQSPPSSFGTIRLPFPVSQCLVLMVTAAVQMPSLPGTIGLGEKKEGKEREMLPPPSG